MRHLLAERGLSQTDLATRARIERTELNRIINGKRDPRSYEIGWLAEAFGITTKELLVGVDATKLELIEEEMERGQAHARDVLTAERERDDAKAMHKALEGEVHGMESGWRAERRDLQAALAAQREDCSQRLTLREEAFAKREQELLDQLAALRDQLTARERELRQAQALAADRGRQAEQLQASLEAARGKIAGAALFAGIVGAAIGSSGKG